MGNLYLEALYNERRNAIPSWQGYHYQAQVAAYYYLKLILQYFEQDETPEKLILKIEWLEDFILFDEDKAKNIVQVKKTLDKNELKDVLENFVIQYLLANNTLIEWQVIYDTSTVDSLGISEECYKNIYQEYIVQKFLAEIRLLEQKKDDLCFLKQNLKLRASTEMPSKLPYTKAYIRKLMEKEEIEFDKITKEQCNKFFNDHLPVIISTLEEGEQKYKQFAEKVFFKKESIVNIERDSLEIINNIVQKSYIIKSGIFSNKDILGIIYNKIYEKLMGVKNKKKQDLVVTYKDIVHIFSCKIQEEYLWDNQLSIGRKNMYKAVEAKCLTCNSIKCKNCIVSNVLTVDFKKHIEEINLELPKNSTKNLEESLNEKLSSEKINYFVTTLFKKKDDARFRYINHRTHFIAQDILGITFLSAHIADPEDDDDIKLKLMMNFRDHEEIYRDYDSILTKNFKDKMCFEDLKLIKDPKRFLGDDDYRPKLKEMLPIDFIDRKSTN